MTVYVESCSLCNSVLSELEPASAWERLLARQGEVQIVRKCKDWSACRERVRKQRSS